MSTIREREFLASMQKPASVSWRGGKRWKPEETENVIALYGVKTASDLGRKYGVSRNAITGIWDRAKKRGVLPR